MSETDELDSSEGINAFDSIIDAVAEWLMGNKDTDYMAYMYAQAVENGRVVFVVCWFVMLLQMIGFLVVYFKRVLLILFLIAIFPLVMISYAIDKVGDGKSQAFDNWMKEYLVNVFVQSFHAIAYVLIMAIVSCLGDDPKDYWLVMLIALSFISKGDDILRAIFSLNSAQGTVKGIGASLMQVGAAKSIARNTRNIGSKMFGRKSLTRKAFNKVGVLNDKKWEARENRAERESQKIKMESLFPTAPTALATTVANSPGAIKEDIQNSIDIALGRKPSTPEEFQKALDKLISYRNQTNNKEMQDAIDEALKGLSPEEVKDLENLLKQNAQVNALITNGVDVNFATNVNLLLAALKRDKNGNLTPESKKLLKKLAMSEDELREMATYSEIKFKEDKSKTATKKVGGRVDSNNYWTSRKEKLNKEKAKGRGAAKRNRETNNLSEATTLFEATRNRNASSIGSGKGNSTGTRSAMKAKNSSMTATERKKMLEQKRKKRNARIAMEKAMSPAKKEVGKKEVGKKVYENVTSRDGVTSGVGKEVVVKKNMVQPGKNMTARRNLKGFSNATIVNTVKYGMPSTTNDTKANGTTTSYAKNIPEQTKISTSIGNAPSTKLEREAAIKSAIANAQTSNSKKSDKSYSGRKKTLLARRYSQGNKQNSTNPNDTSTKQKSEPITFGAQSARASSQNRMQNPGATIAQTQGTATDLMDLLNNPTSVSSNPFSNISNSERIVLEKAAEQADFNKDIEILTDSVEALNDFSSGKYSLDEMIAEAELIKTLREDYNAKDKKMSEDIEKLIGTSKYDIEAIQSDMIRMKQISEMKHNAGEANYTAKELLKISSEFKKLIEKYESGTAEEKRIAQIFINYMGCKPETYETALRVKIINNPDSVGNDKKIIEESKAYLKKNKMSAFMKGRLNYDLEDLRENVNVKYLNSNGNDDGPIRSSEEQKRYKDAIERSKYERKIHDLDQENLEQQKEERRLTRELVMDIADATVYNTATVLSGAGAGGMILGMSVDGKNDVITSLPDQAISSFSLGSDLGGGIVETGFNLRDSGIDLGKRVHKRLAGTKEKQPDTYETPSAKAYRERLEELKKNSNLDGKSFEERKLNIDGNNSNNN